jgi:hypothetical protein
MSEDPEERARAYLVAVEKAINAAETINDRDALRIVDYAKRYVADGRYFLETGKPTTALASVAYAEGLLDSLTILGLDDSSGTTR